MINTEYEQPIILNKDACSLRGVKNSTSHIPEVSGTALLNRASLYRSSVICNSRLWGDINKGSFHSFSIISLKISCFTLTFAMISTSWNLQGAVEDKRRLAFKTEYFKSNICQKVISRSSIHLVWRGFIWPVRTYSRQTFWPINLHDFCSLLFQLPIFTA